MKLNGDHIAGWLPQPSSWGLSSHILEGRRFLLKYVHVSLSRRKIFPRNPLTGIPSGPTSQVWVTCPCPSFKRSWEGGHHGRLPLFMREKKKESGRWVSKYLLQIVNYLSAWDGFLPYRSKWANHIPRKRGCNLTLIFGGFKQAPSVGD